MWLEIALETYVLSVPPWTGSRCTPETCPSLFSVPPPLISCSPMLGCRPNAWDINQYWPPIWNLSVFQLVSTCDNKVTPRPVQGGEWITEGFIWSKWQDAECIWRFRYVSQVCTWTWLNSGYVTDSLQMNSWPWWLSSYPWSPYHTNCWSGIRALEALALTCSCLHSPKDQWTLTTKYHQLPVCHPLSSAMRWSYTSTKAWGHLLQFDFNGVLSLQVMTQYAAVLYAHGAPHSHRYWLPRLHHSPNVASQLSPESLVYTGLQEIPQHEVSKPLLSPNGMIAHLDGLYHTPQNDAGVLLESHLLKAHVQTCDPAWFGRGWPTRSTATSVVQGFHIWSQFMLVSPHAQVGETNSHGVCLEHEYGWGLHLCWACVWDHAPGVDCFWAAPGSTRSWAWLVAYGIVFAVLLTNAHNCFVPKPDCTAL